jgi:hypothetical protein
VKEDFLIIGAIAVAVVAGILQASFFEWVFHRFWLHRPWLPDQVYTAHTLVHHQLCKFDDTFHVTEEEQDEALHFQWWGGPLLISMNVVPWILISWGLSALGAPLPYVVFCVALGVTMFSYYLCYEGLHYLMHKPRYPWIENSGFFQYIKNHHRIHHTQMGRNLNVVLPIADFFLGTLVAFDPVMTDRVTTDAARRTARKNSRRLSVREQAALETRAPSLPAIGDDATG